MKEIRQLIREMLLSEAAFQPSDLPDGVYVEIAETDNDVSVRYCDKEGKSFDPSRALLHGVVSMSSEMPSRGKCSGAFIVYWAKASHGSGPLLYDVLIEFASELGRGVTPDRESVSSAAQRVWSHYLNKRSDITRKILDYKPIPFITLDDKSDDCESLVVDLNWEIGIDSTSSETWENYYKKSPLNYVYFSKGTPTIDKLRAAGKLYERN